MPAPGEFTVFPSEVQVTRTGVPADFKPDITVKGGEDPLASVTATTPIGADQFFASPMGLGQKCIGVQWGGDAQFAAAWVDNGGALNEQDSSAQWVEVSGKDKDALGRTDFTSATAFSPGEFVLCLAGGVIDDKTPAFVAVTGTGGTQGVGAIYHSPNGKFWSKVFTLPNDGGSFGPDVAIGALCWIVTFDGTQFWAAGNKAANVTDPDDPSRSGVYNFDILLSSSDGQSWSEAGSQTIFQGDPFEDTSGLIVPHLSEDVKNGQGIGAPSGYYGIKTRSSDGSKVIIKPSGSFQVDSRDGAYDLTSPSTEVRISGGKKSSNDLGFSVAGVAYGGKGTNLWLAVGPWNKGGNGTAAVSTDDGETWTNIQEADLSVQGPERFMVGVAGVPLKLT